jgi:phospho-N-acetylmuramoyl-pentapeptide-transferase
MQLWPSDDALILEPWGRVYCGDAVRSSPGGVLQSHHGKRIFKMAPLAPSFEMCGWSEYKVFTVFTAVSAVFAVISYFSVCMRFAA